MRASHFKHTAPASPTTVQVSAYIIDLLKIEGSEQSFIADLTIRLSWHDARLAHDNAQLQLIPLQQIWNPEIQIANSRNITNSLPQIAEVQSDGTVTYRQRISGTFTSHFDLHRFPNDQQTLFIDFVSLGHRTEEVQLVANETWTGRAQHLTLSDWSIGEVKMLVKTDSIPSIGVSVPAIRLEVPVQRLVGYYVCTSYPPL